MRYTVLLLFPLLAISWTTGSQWEDQWENQWKVGAFLRERRHLVYPDPKGSETKVQVLFGLGLPMEEEISMTLGYVLKCNYNLPYNSSYFGVARRRRRAKEGEGGQRRDLTRWSLYKTIESAMESFVPGRACLLRAICEAATTPFADEHGLLGELLHVFLTPSTTAEDYEFYSDREYRAAERIGYNSKDACRSFFHECYYNPLDYFSFVPNLYTDKK